MRASAAAARPALLGPALLLALPLRGEAPAPGRTPAKEESPACGAATFRSPGLVLLQYNARTTVEYPPLPSGLSGTGGLGNLTDSGAAEGRAGRRPPLSAVALNQSSQNELNVGRPTWQAGPEHHARGGPPSRGPAALLQRFLGGGASASVEDPTFKEDIFHSPLFQPGVLLKGILRNGTDWAILGVAVVVLLFLDAFMLQPLAARWAARAAREDEALLEEAFRRCDADGKGGVTRAELLAACGDTAAEARLRDLSLPEGAAISLEGFREACQGEPCGADARVGMGSTRANLAALVLWVLMAGVFNVVVWYRHGSDAGVQWCTGYVLEWLLSMDNLFVFHLIFRTYKTPRELVHRALFIGIVGAVVFRMCFFAVLSYLLHLVEWVRFFFGALLIYSGIQAARDEDDDVDVTNTFAVRMLKRCFGSRLQEGYDVQGRALLVRGDDGRLRATLLVLVVLCLEVTDIFFAVDSVSAKVAQIPDFYIAYSSSVLAIFGLRAMFFIIQDLVDCFDLMKYGLCFILVFIGIELMIADWVQLPTHVVCVVIVSVFAVSAAGSVAQKLLSESRPGQTQGGHARQKSVP